MLVGAARGEGCCSHIKSVCTWLPPRWGPRCRAHSLTPVLSTASSPMGAVSAPPREPEHLAQALQAVSERAIAGTALPSGQRQDVLGLAVAVPCVVDQAWIGAGPGPPPTRRGPRRCRAAAVPVAHAWAWAHTGSRRYPRQTRGLAMGQLHFCITVGPGTGGTVLGVHNPRLPSWAQGSSRDHWEQHLEQREGGGPWGVQALGHDNTPFLPAPRWGLWGRLLPSVSAL